MAVASSAATSLAASNSVTTTTQSAPQQQQQQQHMLSPAQMPSQQPMQNVAPTLQQVVIPQQSQQQQGMMQMPPCISSASFGPVTTTTTTTTHAVRSSYKPIAPAPPQQQQQQHQPNQPPNLLAMAPHPHQVNVSSNDKTDQQHPQILTIPVGSAVYPIGMTGTHNIRSATPMNNFQNMNGDLSQHQHGQLNIHMPMSSSQSNTTCFITNPAVTSSARMPTPLGGGLITVGPAAPLSAMANMTHAVPPSSSPITISTQGPRMAMSSLQPVTVTVSASPAPQFPLPSPARTQPSTTPLPSTTEKVEEPKPSPRNAVIDSQTPSAPTTTTPAVEEPSTEKKETPQMNGIGGNQGDHHMVSHSPAIREKKDPNLPQAVVRPQILTHVLGDFVIQESSEPFPVGRFHPNESLTRCNGQRNQDHSFKLDGEPPSKIIFLIIDVLFDCMYLVLPKFGLLMTPIPPSLKQRKNYIWNNLQ
jgi:hypothetical protein